jgi:hypothetical protein
MKRYGDNLPREEEAEAPVGCPQDGFVILGGCGVRYDIVEMLVKKSSSARAPGKGRAWFTRREKDDKKE